MRYWKAEEYKELPEGNYVIYHKSSGKPYTVLGSRFIKEIGHLYPIVFGPLETVNMKDF